MVRQQLQAAITALTLGFSGAVVAQEAPGNTGTEKAGTAQERAQVDLPAYPRQ